ncbi:MAG: NUDIX hydrolase [Segniliparus sp.]|uniref:NUDIX hydrolase n=1 Tax=Segniliparus sp. TaxID=2804064 RepID=UPI003F31EB05
MSVRGDGNGWVVDRDGSKRWGLHGAAGLLLRAPGTRGEAMVLLQHRAWWSHQGGTWSLPGGARDSHESAVETALREAFEETGVDPAQLKVRGERETARTEAGWTYTTVVADAPRVLPLFKNEESEELRWVSEDEVGSLPLHPGMASVWAVSTGQTSVRTRPVTLVARQSDEEVAGLFEILAHGRHQRTVELPDGGFGWLGATGETIDVPRDIALGWLRG